MTSTGTSGARAGTGRLPVLPRHAPGLRIGLLGGSFNPPHEGHRLLSQVALRRLGLDAVWWLVTPGNPLKDTRGLAPLDRRIAAARQVAGDPRIMVTGVEAEIGTRYTVETLRYLKRRCEGVNFVWLIGADNAPGFHRWRRWQDIAGLVPIAIVDRPGASLAAMRSRFAARFAAWRLPEARAAALAGMNPPAWCFIHDVRSAQSSTALRAAGRGLVASPP